MLTKVSLYSFSDSAQSIYFVLGSARIIIGAGFSAVNAFNAVSQLSPCSFALPNPLDGECLKMLCKQLTTDGH